MLVMLYEIGGVHFRLLGANGFHLKAKNERFTAAGSLCRQNIAFEKFTSSFDILDEKACSTCSTILPHSTNQIKFRFFR